jgi:hypothetical protein
MSRVLLLIEMSIEKLFIWVAAITCFFAGLYVALNRTYILLGINNYNLAPTGDGAHDSAVSTYPILLGEQPFKTIYHPFADHRVVFERLWAMYDYLFSQGTQSGLPFRLSITLWLAALLIIGFIIIRNNLFPAAVKLLLTGVVLAVVFSINNISNYNESILMTWPYILVFSLMVFISLDFYCRASKNNSPLRHLYQFLTILFVGLTFLTFNVWMLLWPVIFIVLLKNRCLKFPSAWIWIGVSLLSYKFYFSHHWTAGTANEGYRQFLYHPLGAYLYFSRLVSIPLLSTAGKASSVPTIVIGFAVLSFGCLWLLRFLQRPYSSAENILFACLAYFFTAIIVISIARFWMIGEAVEIGRRFTTPSGMVTISLLAMSFLITYEVCTNKLLANMVLSTLTMVWLIAFYIYGEGGIDTMISKNNQWQIFTTTGVAINDKFIDAVKPWTNEYDKSKWDYLLSVQKRNRKAAFSLWPAQYIGQSIEYLGYQAVKCNIKPQIEISGDYRKKQVPGVFLSVKAPANQAPISTQWNLLFLNSKKQIVGFAISNADPQRNIFDSLNFWKEKNLYWIGALNSNLLNGNEKVAVYAANDKNQQLCQFGDKLLSNNKSDI